MDVKFGHCLQSIYMILMSYGIMVFDMFLIVAGVKVSNRFTFIVTVCRLIDER